MTEVTIIPCDTSDPAELYCRYSVQDGIQPALVCLNTVNGNLGANYNAEIGGGRPASVYNGLTRWYPIPVLTSKAANQLLEKLKPLAQRVLDNSDSEVDGRGNWIGILGTDATAAEDEIYQLCDVERFDMHDLVTEILPEDWLVSPEDITALDVTASTTDDELSAIRARVQEEAGAADAYGYTVIWGLSEHLNELRTSLRVAQHLADEKEQESPAEDRPSKDEHFRQVFGNEGEGK